MNINFAEAVFNDDLEQLKALNMADQKAVDDVDESGYHLSFYAAKLGRYEVVKYLLCYSRVSQDIYDVNRNNVLHYAACSNDLDTFKFLVERIGMDPMAINNDQKSPFDMAVLAKSHTIVKYYEEAFSVTEENVYRNPIVPGTYPDPSIVRVGEDYYMVHSSFVFFPCVPILHSKNLIDWKIIGHAISDPNHIDMTQLDNGRGFWAPDISYNKGRFYITATFRFNDDGDVYRKQLVVHSNKPEGPYSKPTFIDEDGIDPSIFTDDDGKRYMLLNRGARIFEISEDGSKQLSEAQMLWYGENKHAPEAPHLLKKDGYYYCFVSEGGTGRGHQISVGRSKTLMGPYESCPYNPILRQKDPDHPIQRSGHGKLVETPEGEWYIVYLCGRMIDQKYSILGRETGLDKVTWTADGWPLVNNLKGPSGIAIRPQYHGEERNEPANGTTQACVGTHDLSLDWHAPRTIDYDYIQGSKDGSEIVLIPGAFDLSEFSARNVLVKRQTTFNCIGRVSVDLRGLTLFEERGMTCYYDTNTYLKFFVEKKVDSDRLQITLLEHIGSEEKVQIMDFDHEEDTLELYIKVEGLTRRFGYIQKDVYQEIFVAKEVIYLCDEGYDGGKRFTGAMMGIYAIDREGTDNKKATFKCFRMEEEENDYNLPSWGLDPSF